MPTTTTIRVAATLHKALHRISGGRLGNTLRGGQVVFLTTTGRKTGKEHTWPLVGLRRGDDWLVIASNGGEDRHPSWYLNVVAHPDVTLRIGDAPTAQAMTARVAEGDERAELWAGVVAEQPVFAGYESKTDREIPVVVLSPR